MHSTGICIPTVGNSDKLSRVRKKLYLEDLCSPLLLNIRNNIIDATEPTPKRYSFLYKVLITKKQESIFSKHFFLSANFLNGFCNS